MNAAILRVEKGEFRITTDKTELQISVIQDFLVNQSYWAQARTEEQTRRAIEHSVCFGMFKGDRQIGFARVVTDHSTFAYLGDVFVLEEYRSFGLGKWLMDAVISHPDLQGLRRWVLATRDAHGLYERSGFTGLKHSERWMELAGPGAY
jgi:GNAT superfamily N-acetyltransferase